MKDKRKYVQPSVKARVIDMEDPLLQVSGGKKGKLSLVEGDLDTDDIGAKADNTSDGWDDWEE